MKLSDYNYPDQLFNQKQLREMLSGVSNMTIYRMRKSGKLPEPICLNGRNYWTRCMLEKFFAELEGDNDRFPNYLRPLSTDVSTE